MQKGIKKIFSLIFVIVFSMMLLAACTEDKPKEEGVTIEKLEALVFADATFEYDGTEKKLVVENPYEDQGVEVSYRNNKNIKPGTYTVTATISYEDIKVTKKAKITITKASSVLEAESIQTIYLTDKEFKLNYKLNNDKQTYHQSYPLRIATNPL